MANTKVTSDNLDTNIDIAGTFDVTGATTLDSTLAVAGVTTITTADNSDTLSLISTDADANSGPNLRMYRNSGSPADSDAIGLIDFEGRNDNSQDVVYAAIDTRIVDASDGTEDGRIEFATILAGTAGVSRVLMDATETVFNDNSKDLDFRVESDVNTHALFLQGSDGKVGLNKSDPSAYLDVHAPSGVASPTVAIFKADQHGLQLAVDITATATYLQSNHSSYPLILNATTGGNVGVGEHNNLERTLTVGTKLAKTSTSTAVPFAIQTNETTTNGRFSIHYIGGASAADRKVFLQMEEDGVANAGQIHLNHYGGTVHSPQGIIFGTETTAAHTLDDYEEGSWSPNLNGATTTINDAHFVKIGAFVYLNCYIYFSGLPNDSQIFKLTGLPYATQPNSTYGGGVISYTASANTADMQPLTQTGDSYIYFHETDGNNATVTRSTAVSRFANGAGYLLLNMTYMTGF